MLAVGEGERLADRDRDPGSEWLIVALKMNLQLQRRSWGRKEIHEGEHMPYTLEA